MQSRTPCHPQVATAAGWGSPAGTLTRAYLRPQCLCLLLCHLALGPLQVTELGLAPIDGGFALGVNGDSGAVEPAVRSDEGEVEPDEGQDTNAKEHDACGMSVHCGA